MYLFILFLEIVYISLQRHEHICGQSVRRQLFMNVCVSKNLQFFCFSVYIFCRYYADIILYFLMSQNVGYSKVIHFLRHFYPPFLTNLCRLHHHHITIDSFPCVHPPLPLLSLPPYCPMVPADGGFFGRVNEIPVGTVSLSPPPCCPIGPPMRRSEGQ